MIRNYRFTSIISLLIVLLLTASACFGGSDPEPEPEATLAPPTATTAAPTEAPAEAEAEPTEAPAEEPAEETTDEEAYPAPEGGDDTEASSSATDDQSNPYPSPDQPAEDTNDSGDGADVYPPPTPTVTLTQGPDFKIDEPVCAEDTTVTGTGPRGVPIRLISVSEIGLQYSETVIDEDGAFVFEFERALEGQTSIGLKIGDLSQVENADGWTYDDFISSPNYYERPFAGILLDLVNIPAEC
ncbi:MAG: hypothetical protein AAF702_45935 [Chloroflexota bacterium]